jgi:hypothetical protein
MLSGFFVSVPVSPSSPSSPSPSLSVSVPIPPSRATKLLSSPVARHESLRSADGRSDSSSGRKSQRIPRLGGVPPALLALLRLRLRVGPSSRLSDSRRTSGCIVGTASGVAAPSTWSRSSIKVTALGDFAQRPVRKVNPWVNPWVNPREKSDTSVFLEIEIICVLLVFVVDEKGFEPSASSLRTRKNLS